MTEAPHPGLEESGRVEVSSWPCPLPTHFLTSPEPERFRWVVKDTDHSSVGWDAPITNIITDSARLSKLWMSYQVSSIFKPRRCVTGPQFFD